MREKTTPGREIYTPPASELQLKHACPVWWSQQLQMYWSGMGFIAICWVLLIISYVVYKAYEPAPVPVYYLSTSYGASNATQGTSYSQSEELQEVSPSVPQP